MRLDLQVNSRAISDCSRALDGTGIAITPPISESFWLFRVPVYYKQDVPVLLAEREELVKERNALHEQVTKLREALQKLLEACPHEAEGSQRGIAAFDARQALAETEAK